MKFKLKSFVLLLGAAGSSSLAYGNQSQAQVNAELQAVSEQMQQLQNQVNTLQHQISRLKTKSHQSKQVQQHVTKISNPPTQKPVVTTVTKASSPSKPATAWSKTYLSGDFNQSVTIAPYTGTPTYFDGHELLVNDPSINEDVKLLNRRAQEMSYYNKIGQSTLNNHPRLVLSGAVEGSAQYSQRYRGTPSSDINLATAKLDAFVEATSWVSALMTIEYESAPNVTSANRIDNSRLFLDKGFITIGNMLQTPIYGSIGQFYLPFGRYSSSMISSPLTSFVGNSKGRAIVVGYHPGDNRPYAAAYIFHSAANNSTNRINNMGVDLGYAVQLTRVNADVGVSYITNIADAFGFQANGLNAPYFEGFAHGITTNGQTFNAEDLSRKVGGADAHLVTGYGSFALIAEYVTSLKQFASDDLTFDNHGAKPSALNTEVTYSFNAWSKPSSFSLDYGMTRQALALNIPRTRFGAVIQTALMQHTLASLEYRHDINYGRHAYATGFTAPAYISDQLGRSSNTVTAQLGVYF